MLSLIENFNKFNLASACDGRDSMTTLQMAGRTGLTRCKTWSYKTLSPGSFGKG